ncbi:uncharacterized protein [Misgurnus anguillicaudatus]|uniref:uncharacterized protein n=1 Tax=Misgurnus anguillicaudatus TaxID=75329 RepID=UPI003CCFC9A4
MDPAVMDLPWPAYRSHQAHVLFGLRQKGVDVKDFAMDFLRAAKYSGFTGAELKVIFNGCLDKPLSAAEQRTLRPLDFIDTVEYLMNREEPGDSIDTSHSAPLSSVPEGRVVGRMVLESSAPTTSSSISSAPPASLRGSRLAIRGRGILTGAIRLGRSTLVSPAPETTPAPDLRPALPASRRRKKRKKDSSALQPAAIPQSSEKQQPLSAPLQPLPSAQPPLQPLPSAQPPLQPLPSAQPPLQPLPSAQPPLQLPVIVPVPSPLPSAAAPVTVPLSSAQPPLQPLPSVQPPLQPLPSAQPPVIAPVSSSLLSAASPVMIPVSPPQPSAVPPVTVSMSSPPPDAAPPVMVPVSFPQPPAAPPVTVSMSSPLLAAAPPDTVPVSPQPSKPDFVFPTVSSPKNPVRPARPPRTQPSVTPRGQKARPVPSPTPPPVNAVVPPPPLPCLLFLLSHPNPLVVLSCLPLLVFVMFSWMLSSVQSVLSCVSP